jgi:hypothetical protein
MYIIFGTCANNLLGNSAHLLKLQKIAIIDPNNFSNGVYYMRIVESVCSGKMEYSTVMPTFENICYLNKIIDGVHYLWFGSALAM